MYHELKFSEIKAKGWALKYLENQAEGLTGEIGRVGEPFSLPTWGAPKKTQTVQANAFLGGINSLNDAWVPYEQNGYWIDGMIRAGRLADNEKLIKQAQEKIYPEIEQADADGYIGPEFIKDGLTWAHAVYFRSWIAEYTATGDERILEALKRHFLRRPLTKSYEKEDLRIIAVRNVADIETALWIYGQTSDERFLNMAEDSYAEFNRRFSDDSVATPNDEMFDITLDGMLGNRKVCRNHGVTYCEVCKLAAILHMYTGKEVYKKAAIKAFDKLYRDQILIDGVPSSTEYLNGNEDSHAMHETCDVSDFTWAVGYLYMITGDPKYGDWVENAVFNAGLGSVDDDFKGNQYFSCPNQAIADDTSNHVKFFRGREWTSYAPEKFLACCAGNVHRFMPNFIYRSWMRSGNVLSAFTYTPCEICVDINGVNVKIEEISDYPFKNEILFKIHAEKAVEFSLELRKPAWATGAEVIVNGEPANLSFKGGKCVISREFKEGDQVLLKLQDKIEYIENAHGVSVKKGALLYALAIDEKTVIEGLRELNNPDFPHYSLYAESKWNYGLCSGEAGAATFKTAEQGDEPWRKGESGLSLDVCAREVKNWKLQKVKSFYTRFKPRAKCQRVSGSAVFTPKVREITQKTPLGDKETLSLVPYCTTRLRITIFPKI